MVKINERPQATHEERVKETIMKRRILIKPEPRDPNGSTFGEAFGSAIGTIISVVVILILITCAIVVAPKFLAWATASSEEPNTPGGTALPDNYKDAFTAVKDGLNKKYNMNLTSAQVRELDCRAYSGYKGRTHHTCFTSNKDAHDETYGSTLYTNDKGETVAITLSLKEQRPILKTQFESQDYMKNISELRKTLESKYKAKLSDEQLSQLNCHVVDDGFSNHYSSCYTQYNSANNRKFGTTTVSYHDQEQKATLVTDGSGNPVLIEPGTEGQYIRN